MAAKEFIVAIELGSSKITGIAGKKSMDGSLQVLAVVREDATPCIRKGVVYNIDKTSVCLTNIIKKLQALLKSEISKVYVGVGGQSIRSIRNSIAKKLPEDTIISQDIINELMDNNRSTHYTDLEILDAATQEYKIGTLYHIDPVGIQSDRIEGNFLNIVCRKAFYRNLNRCFEKANITIAEMYLAPIALAHSILTEDEMRSGCLLVDLGAGTTTVSVYHKNILRHLAVIPLGGNEITKDITTLLLEEDEAEKLKIDHAFHELVEARVNEIIQNVWFGQVAPEYKDKLMGGIILTGGGSNMKGMKKAFSAITGIQKIRIAGTVKQKVTSNDKDINAQDGMMNTALGLLAKGDMNCSGAAINPTTNLFDTHAQTNSMTTDTQRTTNSKPCETGRVESPDEKLLREKTRHREDKPIPNKPVAPSKGGWLYRGYRFLQNLGTTIISAENEDDYRC